MMMIMMVVVVEAVVVKNVVVEMKPVCTGIFLPLLPVKTWAVT